MRRGRGTARRTPEQPCLNCGDGTPGDYCRNCGQAKRRVAVSVRAMVADVLEDQLVLNRALPRTIYYLLLRPGLLTVEYVNGRIVRYIAPFRLYLATSVVFFLLLSFFGLRALENVQVGEGGAAAADSVRAGVAEGLRSLEAIDTTSLPPEARSQVAAALRQLQSVPDSVPAVDVGEVAAPAASDRLQPWARSLRRGTADADALGRRIMERVVTRYGHLEPREAIREFADTYLEYVPHMVFLLLPIFALLLKLLYIRRGRYYAEHFVFALHVHAFAFFMFILMFAIRDARINGVIFLWMTLYVWLAMKRVYGQGFFRTTFKYWVLGFCYFVLLSTLLTFGIVGALLYA